MKHQVVEMGAAAPLPAPADRAPWWGRARELDVVRGDVGPDILVVTPTTFEALRTPTRDGLILVTLTDPDGGGSVAQARKDRLTQQNPGM